jgi:hypothetical protein
MEYRVTRAHLIIVSDSGANTAGRISVISSPDFADLLVPVTVVGGGVGGTTVSVASLQSKPLRVPLRIDGRWMKVSPRTMTLSVTNGLITENATNDLCFSNVSMAFSDIPANTNVCTFYVEYDVEFRGPIMAANNL